MLTKKEADKLMKIEGEVRGMAPKVDLEFIIEKKGEQGLKKVETKMAELGFPLKYKEIRVMDFYPLGMDVILMLVIKEVFNFDEKDFEQWGRSVVKFSLFLKIFMKYFSSLKLTAKQIPKIWRKYYTVGNLEIPEFSEERRYAILRMRNFQIHPIYCNILGGYYSKVTEMVVKAPVTCKETKCMFRGDKYHEYLLTW